MGNNNCNRKYTNGEINVFWQAECCVHAAVCISELPRVFNMRRRPWVDLSQAKSEDIIETVCNCPTNALMFSWVDPKKNANETRKNKLLLNYNPEDFENRSCGINPPKEC